MPRLHALLFVLLTAVLACNFPSRAVSPTPPPVVVAPTAIALPTVTSPNPQPAAPPAAQPPTESAPAFPMQIAFLDPADGGSVIGTMDEHGVPVIAVSVEVSGATPFTVALTANGLPVQVLRNEKKDNPFRADFLWSPHVAGAYTLAVNASGFYDESGNLLGQGSNQITVNVADAPPPPVTARIIELYQQQLGLTLTAPAIARINSDSKWVSVAYIGSTLYEVGVFDDGQYWYSWRSLNSPGDYPACRPAGQYRVLTAFVDYGNTGIAKEDALSALQNAAAQTNARYAEAAARLGLAAPILQLDSTGVYISPPPAPGQMLTVEQVRAATGIDPANYDILAQVDLDSAHTLSAGHTEGQAGGLAMGGCPGAGAQWMNLWAEVTAPVQLDGTLAFSLFDHELDHVMGWQHHWPCADASGPDISNCNPILPVYLFGWTGNDGDGVAEILDPAPYGLVTP